MSTRRDVTAMLSAIVLLATGPACDRAPREPAGEPSLASSAAHFRH